LSKWIPRPAIKNTVVYVNRKNEREKWKNIEYAFSETLFVRTDAEDA
jgi:hypothetical protein